MKKCRKCEKNKDGSEFYKDRASSDGLTSSCKECQLKRSKNYYRKNREERKKVNREKYVSVELTELKCQNCNAAFKGYKNTQYCSLKCRNQKAYQRTKGTFKFTCKGCGKIAYATSCNRQNYCTHACFSKNSPHFKNREFKHNCAVCQKPFISKSNYAKYCAEHVG